MPTNNVGAQPHPCRNSKCPLAPAEPAGSAVASIMATIKPSPAQENACKTHETYDQKERAHQPGQRAQPALARGCPLWTEDQRSTIVEAARAAGWAHLPGRVVVAPSCSHPAQRKDKAHKVFQRQNLLQDFGVPWWNRANDLSDHPGPASSLTHAPLQKRAHFQCSAKPVRGTLIRENQEAQVSKRRRGGKT